MMVVDRVEGVLRAAELVRPGRVVSYGDIAGLLGMGPRQVGAIMSSHGAAVPWWRVTNHRGELPGHLTTQARDHWRREGTPMFDAGARCRISQCREDLDVWAAAVLG